MICKWCGAGVNPADKKCARCGREIPALSDCGGFYDVAPRALRNAPQPRETVPVAPAAPAPAPVQGGKAGLVLSLVALLAVAALIIAAMAMMGRISELESRVYSLSGQVEELKEAQEPTETVPESKPIAPKPSEPRDPQPTDPSEEPLSTESTDPTGNSNTEESRKHGWFLSDDLSSGEEGKIVRLSGALNTVDTVRTRTDGTFVYDLVGDGQTAPAAIRVNVDRTRDYEYTLRCCVEGDGLGRYQEDAKLSVLCGEDSVEPVYRFVTDDGGVLNLEITIDLKKSMSDLPLSCVIEWMGESDLPLTLELSGLEAITV